MFSVDHPRSWQYSKTYMSVVIKLCLKFSGVLPLTFEPLQYVCHRIPPIHKSSQMKLHLVSHRCLQIHSSSSGLLSSSTWLYQVVAVSHPCLQIHRAERCPLASADRLLYFWPIICINCSLCGIPVVWSDYEMIRVGKPQKQIIFFWRDWFRWLPPVCDRAAAVSSQWMKLQVQFKISRSDSHNLSIVLFPAKTSLFCCLLESAKDEKFSYSTVLFKLYDM